MKENWISFLQLQNISLQMSEKSMFSVYVGDNSCHDNRSWFSLYLKFIRTAWYIIVFAYSLRSVSQLRVSSPLSSLTLLTYLSSVCLYRHHNSHYYKRRIAISFVNNKNRRGTSLSILSFHVWLTTR